MAVLSLSLQLALSADRQHDAVLSPAPPGVHERNPESRYNAGSTLLPPRRRGTRQVTPSR